MYRTIFAISAFVAAVYIGAASATMNCGNDPVAKLGLDPIGIIKYWNYTGTEHWVTSPDGYIIHMVRITGKQGETNNCQNREPVIVHHGLLCSSADWFVLDAPKATGQPGALPFMLWDAGYDVWVPSARGSTLSLNHTTLSPNDVAFWQFSWNEMGKNDVPAMINYVLTTSNKPKLSWVGHSMGCAVFLVAAHYNQTFIESKVRKVALLAPAAEIGGSTSPVVLGLAPFPQQIPEAAFIAASNGALLPTNANLLTNKYAAGVCSAMGYLTTDVVCQNALYAIAGFPKDGQYNIQDCNVARVVSHTPATTSYRCISHFVQTKQTNQFKAQCNNIENADPASAALLNTMFSGPDPINELLGVMDSFSPSSTPTGRRKKRSVLSGITGGLIGNLTEGLTTPLSGTFQLSNKTVNLNIVPKKNCELYQLSRTTVPVLVMCGDSDSLVVPSDCKWTASQIAGPVTQITIPNFQHLDFQFATNASNSVNVPVVQYLNAGKPQC